MVSLMKQLGVAALLLAAFTLTGCAGGGTSYTSPESLTDAYVDAGGECDDPADVPEAMLSEGAHGILCGQPMAMLLVFDSTEAKDRYLARTGDSDMVAYGGDRWLALAEESDVISKLGGSEIAQ